MLTKLVKFLIKCKLVGLHQNIEIVVAVSALYRAFIASCSDEGRVSPSFAAASCALGMSIASSFASLKLGSKALVMSGGLLGCC